MNENSLKSDKSFFRSVKKLILVLALFVSGILLVLGGFGLIEFTPNLLKYTGAALLILAGIYQMMY